MIKKNTIITDWLDKYGDPQIEKKVMERLEKITKELIIDEVYKNYIEETNKWSDSGPHNISLDELKMIGAMTGAISNARIRQYTKEEFINKCKTDTEFSEKWGLKIEERELSLEERKSIYENEYTESMEVPNNHWLNSKLTTRNIPTKLITLKYKDTILESYE
jgi:hypothetical protein